MSNNNNLHTSHRIKNDEYHTTMDIVEKAILPYLDYLKGKRILCPCDTEHSNFVIRLKELGYNVEHYHKENGEEWYKPNDYDVCLTNPPFSKIREFYNTYKDKPLCLIVNNIGITNNVPFIELSENVEQFEYIDGTDIINIAKVK